MSFYHVAFSHSQSSRNTQEPLILQACHQSQPDQPTWSCLGDTEGLAVQRRAYSSPNPSPNLLPQSPKENSSNGRVREASGVLVHSLAFADAPNFSLSLIQTETEPCQSNLATQRSKPGGAQSIRKETLHLKEEKNPDKKIRKDFLDCPKGLGCHFYIHLREINLFGVPRHTQGDAPTLLPAAAAHCCVDE